MFQCFQMFLAVPEIYQSVMVLDFIDFLNPRSCEFPWKQLYEEKEIRNKLIILGRGSESDIEWLFRKTSVAQTAFNHVEEGMELGITGNLVFLAL